MVVNVLNLAGRICFCSNFFSSTIASVVFIWHIWFSSNEKGQIPSIGTCGDDKYSREIVHACASRQHSDDVDKVDDRRLRIRVRGFVQSRRKDVRRERAVIGRRLERVLKQSSPQISVASRLLSPVPKSHPHTLKTSRSVRAGWSTELASAGPPLTFTPILSPYDWCL